MTAHDIAAELKLTAYAEGEPERPVTGGYAGDLLSWVMGHALPGSAWFTIMSNVNVAGVAVMADAAMVIMAEGTAPDPELLLRAQREGLNLYSSSAGVYELCWRLYGLIGP